MKKFLLFGITWLFLSIGIATMAEGSDLRCDPQTGVTEYRIQIDGVVVETNFAAEADGRVRYNVDHLADGQWHNFVLWAIDASGWRSDASAPFDARKPSASGSVRIENDVAQVRAQGASVVESLNKMTPAEEIR